MFLSLRSTRRWLLFPYGMARPANSACQSFSRPPFTAPLVLSREELIEIDVTAVVVNHCLCPIDIIGIQFGGIVLDASDDFERRALHVHDRKAGALHVGVEP